MNFLRGQDDFFQTANQPISVRHLSQPYNNSLYFEKTFRWFANKSFILLVIFAMQSRED